MTTEIHDRLRELAADAPAPATGDIGDLWRAGKRRQRRRTAAGAVAACALLLAGLGGAGLVSGRTDREPPPVTPPADELHLPDRIDRPDPWSQGTAEVGEIGPLAAIGEADRFRAKGWSDTIQSHEVFGVSAVDGTTRFLDFGLDPTYQVPWGGLGVALSPDGTKVGFVLERASSPEAEEAVTEGWAVYDTVTGRLTEFRDPEAPRIEGTPLDDLQFTADSRYLVTIYPFSGSWRENDHGLVLWDTETGKRIVAEEPGHYWRPGVGEAPGSILIDRKFEVRQFDPETGSSESFRLPKAVVTSSLGPDGRAFAYIGGDWTPGRDGGINGRTWRLYAGPDRSRLSRVPLGFEGGVSLILGWSDPSHVVVSDYGSELAEVAVDTGHVRRFSIDGLHGSASLASDFLGNEVVRGLEPPDAQDPRTWWRRGAYAVGLLAVAGLIIWRRRARG